MLAILIPVKWRPHRVEPVLESIRATTDAHVIFIPDPGDKPEIEAIDKAGAEKMIVEGNYARKINEAVRRTHEPLLLFAADDLEFHEGWFEAAKAKLTKGIGVVGTNDLCNPRVMKGELATHPLVTRAYTKRGTMDNPEVTLHEGYVHEYVDREFSETAQYRKAFAYAPTSIVEHLHPMVGKAPTDELYDAMWGRMWKGRRHYTRRQHLWGSPTKPERRIPRQRIDGWKPRSS